MMGLRIFQYFNAFKTILSMIFFTNILQKKHPRRQLNISKLWIEQKKLVYFIWLKIQLKADFKTLMSCKNMVYIAVKLTQDFTL